MISRAMRVSVPSRRVGIRFGVLVAFLVGCVSTLAPGKVPPALIADLDAPDLEQREAAMQSLLSDGSLSDSDFVDVLMRRDELSPEQFDRLLLIGETRFMRGTAAIGIRLDTVDNGIKVTMLYADAPAARVLEKGDVITSIDGEPLGRDASPDRRLQEIIADHRAGDRVDVIVQRGEKRLELTIELADVSKLTGFGTSTLVQIRRQRWDRIRESVMPAPMLLEPDPRVIGGIDLSPPDQPQVPAMVNTQLRDRLRDRLRALDQERKTIRQQIVDVGNAQLKTALIKKATGLDEDYDRIFLQLEALKERAELDDAREEHDDEEEE